MCTFQNDLYDWLRMLNLEQYFNTLANQGFDNIDYVIDITWEDLEEIGIQRLGNVKSHSLLLLLLLYDGINASKRSETLQVIISSFMSLSVQTFFILTRTTVVQLMLVQSRNLYSIIAKNSPKKIMKIHPVRVIMTAQYQEFPRQI